MKYNIVETITKAIQIISGSRRKSNELRVIQRL